VRNFAERYGVLGLCKDHLPRTHSAGPDKPLGCDLISDGAGVFTELVETWRVIARLLTAVIRLSQSLRADGTGETLTPAETYAAWREVALGDEGEGERLAAFESRKQAEHLSMIQNGLLRLGDVRPHVQWDGTNPTRLLLTHWPTWDVRDDLPANAKTATPLFAQLAVATVARCLSARPIAVCSACGVTFTPTRVRAPGRRTFCAGCGKKAAWKLAQQERRQKERAKREPRTELERKRREFKALKADWRKQGREAAQHAKAHPKNAARLNKEIIRLLKARQGAKTHPEEAALVREMITRLLKAPQEAK
jgi:hypothetical protein